MSTDAAAVAFASAGVHRKGDENEWADTPRNVMVRRFTAYPEGDKRDAEAYKGAIEKLPKGSIVISQSCLGRGSVDRLVNAARRRHAIRFLHSPLAPRPLSRTFDFCTAQSSPPIRLTTRSPSTPSKGTTTSWSPSPLLSYWSITRS